MPVIGLYTDRMKPTPIAAFVLALHPLTGLASAQPDEPTLFVPHYFAGGATVATYIINTDGTLTMADNEPSGIWSLGAAISPDGATLAVGNAAGSDDGSSTTDQLYLFHVNADSTLSLIGTATVPSSPQEMAWLDDDTLAYFRSDLGNSFINSYDVDLEDGTLTLVDTVVPGGFGTSLAIDRDNSLLFAQDSFGETIFRYTFDNAGTMTPAGSVMQATFPLDLVLSPDGTKLYTASGISGNSETITGFNVNAPSDPTPLAPLPSSPYISAGDSPAFTAMSGHRRLACLCVLMSVPFNAGAPACRVMPGTAGSGQS